MNPQGANEGHDPLYCFKIYVKSSHKRTMSFAPHVPTHKRVLVPSLEITDGFIFPKRVLVPYLNIADGFTFGKKRWVILVASKGKFVCLATKKCAL